MSRGLEDYNNALMAFNTGRDDINSYISSKRDDFFKDYNSAIAGANAKFQTAVARQAEQLGLDQEKQEKLSNLIETSTLAAPVLYKAGSKLAGLASARFGGSATEAPTTAPASITTESAEEEAGAEAGETAETAESAGEGAEATEAGETAEGAGESIEMVGMGANAARGLPAGLNLAQSSGFLQGPVQDFTDTEEEPETAQEGQEAEEAEEADEAEEAGEVGETAEATEGVEAGIAGATAEAEGATGGALSEVILPAAALASVGYSLYSLFHHSSSSASKPIQRPAPVTGSATGIADSLTRGGFASAGIDSVTSLPAQNSAF